MGIIIINFLLSASYRFHSLVLFTSIEVFLTLPVASDVPIRAVPASHDSFSFEHYPSPPVSSHAIDDQLHFGLREGWGTSHIIRYQQLPVNLTLVIALVVHLPCQAGETHVSPTLQNGRVVWAYWDFPGFRPCVNRRVNSLGYTTR